MSLHLYVTFDCRCVNFHETRGSSEISWSFLTLNFMKIRKKVITKTRSQEDRQTDRQTDSRGDGRGLHLNVKQSYYRPGQAHRVPGGWGSHISRNLHINVVRCQPYVPAAITPRIYSWYSFLSETKSTPGPYCGRKEYVNKKFQWHHQESTRDLPASSAGPQPTASPSASVAVKSIVYCFIKNA
jgi:hypothetical protein